MDRALHRWVNLQNQTTGWVFENRRGVRSKFGIYDHVFRDLVDRARELHFRLLPEVVETGDFSLKRSPRRGAVLETTNQDVAEKVIELINRWCKKEAAKGSKAGLPMRHPSQEYFAYHVKVLQGPLKEQGSPFSLPGVF